LKGGGTSGGIGRLASPSYKLKNDLLKLILAPKVLSNPSDTKSILDGVHCIRPALANQIRDILEEKKQSAYSNLREKYLAPMLKNDDDYMLQRIQLPIWEPMSFFASENREGSIESSSHKGNDQNIQHLPEENAETSGLAGSIEHPGNHRASETNAQKEAEEKEEKVSTKIRLERWVRARQFRIIRR